MAKVFVMGATGGVGSRVAAQLVKGCEQVFDLTLALAQVAEGYRAMDERRATKALLCEQGQRRAMP